MNALMPGGPNDPAPILHFPNLPIPWCYMTPQQLAAMNTITPQAQPSIPGPYHSIPDPRSSFPGPQIQMDLDPELGSVSDVSLTRKRIQPETSVDDADDEESIPKPAKKRSKKKKVKGGEMEMVLSKAQSTLSEPQKQIRKELQVYVITIRREFDSHLWVGLDGARVDG